MNVIAAIRTFIASCPLLKRGALHIDYLPYKPVHYTIEAMPTSPILKTYVDGSTKRQCNFVFASREFYSEDILQNIKNCNFYEDFSAWLEQQTRMRSLPNLGEKRNVISIQALTTGMVFDTTTKDARYQIQCRLIYFQEE